MTSKWWQNFQIFLLSVRKENKNDEIIQQFLLFRQSLMHVHNSTRTHVCAFLWFNIFLFWDNYPFNK